MSDPNRPYDPAYGEQPPPAYPPAQAPGTPTTPVGHPRADDEAVQPVTSGTQDPRLGLEVGRFWAGALATMLVAALIGLAAVFLLEEVFNLDIQSPPAIFGTGTDYATWAVVGAVFALLSAIVLYLLVLSTPRPRSFFGWVIALATVILAALPFAGEPEIVPAVLAAVVWIVLGSAVWSLLTGTLSRTVVRRSAV
ncbi:hypothetical protein [Antribacter gilvus]|uniref:hypothetical protein n=1 Tax=Antribacter gilvus TaxID=2304675 RepID=UPI000F7792DB|nr:hypothetical protein [Antribacter gilvus]